MAGGRRLSRESQPSARGAQAPQQIGGGGVGTPSVASGLFALGITRAAPYGAPTAEVGEGRATIPETL